MKLESILHLPVGKPGLDEVVGYRGVGTDITDRKQEEDRREKHRDHLEEMVKNRTTELQATINLMAGRKVRMPGLKE